MTTEEALAALGRYASDEGRARAEAYVRRMAAVVEAACEIDDEMVLDPDCDEDSMFVRLRIARDALDGGER